MLVRLINLSLCLLLTAIAANAQTSLAGIKSYLQGREKVPKLYIQEQVYHGSAAKLMVSAPGAKKVSLLGSRAAYGIEGYDHLNLNLGKDAAEIASKELNSDNNFRASFEVPFTEESMIGQDYFVEAIVVYDHQGEEKIRKAAIFGSNANFSGNNNIKIMAKPEDYSGVANYARSLVPGLGAGAGGGY